MIKYLALAFILVSSRIFSQEEFKPENKEFGLSLGTNSVLPIILDPSDEVFKNLTLDFKYALSDQFRLGLGIGFTGKNSKSEKVILADIESSTHSENGFSLLPSVEYHFLGTPRLDPYIGILLGFNFGGKVKDVTLEQFANNGTTFTLSTTKTLPSTIGFGTHFIVGFDYYIFDRLSLGIETGFGYNIVKQSGDKTITTFNNGAYSASSEKIVESNSGFNNFPVGIKLGYFFGSLND
jgi:outer membrane protein W